MRYVNNGTKDVDKSFAVVNLDTELSRYERTGVAATEAELALDTFPYTYSISWIFSDIDPITVTPTAGCQTRWVGAALLPGTGA